MIVSESLEFITNVNHIIRRLVSFKNNRPKTSFGKKVKNSRQNRLFFMTKNGVKNGV